ncbi:MAG: mandelate racemase/muconate lactonizing enzyme family protein [Armatimonadota bacterium]|nr:mandelate racemase/muconate lactonizing enzyme family protein [Armatimonadota bacterium]MDR7463180.1 mandelate racemase/muconate lactonizing enzyme family protein [Armatimonadota bacterium]
MVPPTYEGARIPEPGPPGGMSEALGRRRIAAVQAFHLAARLNWPLGGSARRQPLSVRQSTIVRLLCDDGLVGYGECMGPPTVLVPAVRHLAPLVLGADPLARNVLTRALMTRAREEGSTGPLVAAVSGIDLALWDLAARALDVPLVVLLGGGVRDQVPTYAASVYFSSLDEAVDVAGQFVARGFRSIKVKVGMGVEEDAVRVAAIRDHVGPEVRLLLDANGAYDAKAAITLARRCDSAGIFWIEEPVPADDLEGCRRVRDATALPIAAGENLSTRQGFAPWIAARAVDVVMPDLGRCGGLTEAMAVAAMASAHGVAVSPHCWGSSIAFAAAVHLAAALPHCQLLEFDAHPDPLREALLGDVLNPRSGAVAVPAGPGIGVEVQEAALREFAAPDGG